MQRKVPFLTFVVNPYKKVKVNLAGCNFNCKGCFALAKQEVGMAFSAEELVDLLIKSCQLIYGKIVDEVQLTGGEPILNLDYLLCLIRKLREVGVNKIGISTNGYLLDKNLVEELSFLAVDYIKLDLKAYTEEVHRWYTGKSNINVFRAVELLSKYGFNFYVRTILIPEIVDLDEIEKIAKFLSQVDRRIPYRIYQFAPEYTKDKTLRRSPNKEQMLRASNIAKGYLANAEAYTTETVYQPDSKYIEVRADELLDEFKRIDEISKSIIKTWDMPYFTMNQILTSQLA
ncbi:radical SAM protein [Dehalococcoidales bacterium]|nr:radical SAM protein [Dehalococcoidales bacterium]